MQELRQAAYNGSPSSRAAPNSGKEEIPAGKMMLLAFNFFIAGCYFFTLLYTRKGC